MKWICAMCLMLICVTPASARDDLEIVRERLVRALLPDDPAAREQIVTEAAARAATFDPATGAWPEIDYFDRSATFWKAKQHLENVLLMSRAYRMSRDAGRPDAGMLASIRQALDYWFQHDYQNRNWWHNQIGVPQLLGTSTLLLMPDLSPAQLEKVGAILRRSNWSKWTGQNLVWGVTTQVARGLIESDPDAVSAAYNRLYDEVRITTDEGIQHDFSFHQHGDQLYSGGYGLAFAQDVPRHASFTWGTRWQIPDEKLSVLNGYLLEGEQWMMHRSRFDYSACGREIVRKGKTAVPKSWTSGPISPVGASFGLLNSLRLYAEQPVPRQSELALFVSRLRESKTPPFVGNRHFWRSDYMAHHQPGWFASVRMFSTRLANTELINSEGKKSQHLADGCNLLYVTGDEYFDIFPVWDWMKIPGTTAEQTLDIADEHNGGIGVRGKTSFVGGVSDGSAGFAVMDLVRGTLTARKAWFLFDDGYLCLGAGITSSGDKDVVTTINQCLVDGPTERSDGWVHHAGVGYLVGGDNLKLTADTQEGRWSDIGTGSDVLLKQKVFKLWIDHGQRPSGAAYQYVVLPCASVEQTRRAAGQWPARVISNTPKLQAAAHEASKTFAAAFYDAGEIEWDGQKIAVDQPCLLLMRDGKLTVSNPDNQPLIVNATVNGKGQRIELPDGPLAGQSVSTSLGR